MFMIYVANIADTKRGLDIGKHQIKNAKNKEKATQEDSQANSKGIEEVEQVFPLDGMVNEFDELPPARGIAPLRCSQVTTGRAALRRRVRQIMLLNAQDAAKGSAGYLVAHSSAITFIGPHGRIRGYGDWNDGVDTLTQDMREALS